MISTWDLSALPTIDMLMKLTQSLAMLDAIIMREWEYRYYLFNSRWAPGEMMASMENGSGDSWFCVFGQPGAFLKGFDHESQMSPWSMETQRVWPGVLEGIPQNFKRFSVEPAFSMEATTFCIWRDIHDPKWNAGNISYPDGEDPDGSAWMLSILDGDPKTYKEWAEGYYECAVDLSVVERIYGHMPLTPELAKQLNEGAEFESLLPDAAQIDYPIARL